ncbi:FIG027190: Putative transmembrane protein [hydrothermal vent metagenome]|uniref:FIG027190: Putative transmembrane protein n=1 Tax=hydrothermal vent metagenome TaxID=652676 RepID=A0A3B0YTN7_9ZZZZ
MITRPDPSPARPAPSPAEVIEFWFSGKGRGCWFNSTPELDGFIKSRYEYLWQSACNNHLLAWQNSAEGCLALAIIFDQFPLNMFRGLAESFSSESQAVAITHLAVESDFDKAISYEKLAFLYVPLMHSENLNDQELSVKLFTENKLSRNIRYAIHHRDLIKKFGRFPHRNIILGRESTVQEIEYLNSKQAFLG